MCDHQDCGSPFHCMKSPDSSNVHAAATWRQRSALSFTMGGASGPRAAPVVAMLFKTILLSNEVSIATRRGAHPRGLLRQRVAG